MTLIEVMIYLRTSTEEQNPENQLKDCVSINHYGEHEVIEDKQSAWKDNQREGFERLKELIKQGKVKHLIVWDFDRIYRNRIKFKEFLAFLKAYGVQLHSFRQDWIEDLHKIPSPWNEIVYDLMINIYGHLAEDDSKRKSQRVKIAVRREPGEPTKSYNGNVWGRKALNQDVIDKVLALHKQGMSVRDISKQVFYWDKSNNKKQVSSSTVHKFIKENKLTKQS
jgi:DNA invertase Pin-like site-specific DNA recombinase